MGGTEPAFSLRASFQLLLRHWKKIFGFAAVTMAVAVAVIMYYPKTYASEAKLYVRMGRENVMLDPTVTAARAIMVQRSQENEVNSLLDILGSRSMAEQVADAVGVERILSKGTCDPATPRQCARSSTLGVREWVDRAVTAVSYPVGRRDRAIQRVQRSVVVRAPKESTVITIRSRAASPELARAITAAMVDASLEAHLHLNRTRGTYKFFAEQSEMLRKELAEVSRELSDRKSEFGMLSIEGRRKALEDQISALELQARTADRELAAARAHEHALEEQIARSDLNVTATLAGVGHEGWDRMRQQLYDLQLAELELSTKCTDEFPKLVAIRRQREEAEKILKNQPPDRTQVTSSPNPTYQALQLELARQSAETASVQSSHDLLARQVADLSGELKTVNAQAFEIKELERRAAILETNYLKHVDKLEEARIDDALEKERISSLNVVQAATFESKPASPKRGLTLLGAMVIAGFGGLAIAVLAEGANPRIHTPQQAEEATRLPVLAWIPKTGRYRAAFNGERIEQ